MADAGWDIQRHQRGWNSFVRFVTWGIVGTVVTLGLMALFLV